MKVKFFVNEGDVPELEKEINKWLIDKSKLKVLHIKQNFAYDNVQFFHTIISIWYEER